MKNFIITGICLCLGIAMLYSCSHEQVQKWDDSGIICNNYKDVPVNQMDKNEVKDMISNYYQKQYAAINASTVITFGSGLPTDSRCVFLL